MLSGKIEVLNSGGNPFSHRHVRFKYGSPKSQGFITQSGFGKPNIFMGVGFSTQIFGQSAL